MRCKETSFRGLRLERVRASKQFDTHKATFQNPTGKSAGLKGNPLPVLGEFFFGGGQRMPPGPLPIVKPHDSWRTRVNSGLRVTWLGHSTVLLEIDGFTILTDPVFGDRASPVTFAGPKRFHPVPAKLDELPPIDVVLLSHDHYDHLCRETMTALAGKEMPIVTALGVGARLEAMGVAHERIHELDWDEHIDLRGLRITATPCQHFSGRGTGDRNKTLWASWVIQTEKRKVFFSGDTGLTDQFKTIGDQHGPFELTLLEVGAFHESWGDIHLGPENALEAFKMLGGGTLLPVHWGTFNLALHDWDEPAETLIRLAEAQQLRVITPRIGQVFEPAHLDGPFPDLTIGASGRLRRPAPQTPWWREVQKSKG